MLAVVVSRVGSRGWVTGWMDFSCLDRCCPRSLLGPCMLRETLLQSRLGAVCVNIFDGML